MPPRNPKSVLYTVKNTISPDKKRTCLEMKKYIQKMNVFSRLSSNIYLFITESKIPASWQDK